MAILKKVRSVLEAGFPRPDKVKLEKHEKIIGTVTSRRFEGMETIDRINLIWDLLESGLTADERKQVLMIVPATPEEEIAYTA